MSGNTIELEFGDGTYLFALPLERIDELQRKCDIGIGGLFARLVQGSSVDPESLKTFVNPAAGAFYAVDIVETLKQGLIGGGRGVVNEAEVKVTPLLANQLIRNYVLDRPLKDSWTLAISVLAACIMGYEPPKKASAGGEPAPGVETPSNERTDGSTGA